MVDADARKKSLWRPVERGDAVTSAALMIAICLAPQRLVLKPGARGLCDISSGAARLTLPVACPLLKVRRAMGPVLVVDRKDDGRTERLFLLPTGGRLAVVLRRDVFLETLPIEESGDTTYERARFTQGVAVNGLPSIVEVRRIQSRTFNQVDPPDQDTEVTTTTFVFDGAKYGPLADGTTRTPPAAPRSRGR